MALRQPPPQVAPELAVRGYLPGDEEALVAMFSSIFHERSLAEWRWLFRQGPAGPPDVRVLESEGRPVGAVSYIRLAAWVEGRRLRLGQGCDLMVLPECRGRGGAELLVKDILSSEHGFDVTFGTVNEGSGHITAKYMGSTVLGRVPTWVRYRTRGAGRNPVLRHTASLAERALGAALSRPRPGLAVADLERLGAEVDRLADDSRDFAPCIRVRDSAYLRWHWLEQPGARWRIRAVWGEDALLRGIAVIGAHEQGHGRQGVVADLLARDAAAQRALLADAWARLTAEGCHSVTCAYLDPRPWARRAMLRSGFRPLPGTRVGCAPRSPSAGESVRRLESWYLTYGDIDL